MRIFVCLMLVVVLVSCASAPAPAVQGPSAWRSCVDLMDRADYQEAAYMASIGLPFESKTIAERWAPCEGLPKAGSVETVEPDPHDRADKLLSILLLNQLIGSRR